MERIFLAAMVVLLMCTNAIAGKAVRVDLTYACSDDVVYERINEALLNGHDDLFHERLSRAVKSGECRIVDAEKSGSKGRSSSKKSLYKPKSKKHNKVVRSAENFAQKGRAGRRAKVSKPARSDYRDDGGFPTRETFEPVR